jgi:hypothetical protein
LTYSGSPITEIMVKSWGSCRDGFESG